MRYFLFNNSLNRNGLFQLETDYFIATLHIYYFRVAYNSFIKSIFYIVIKKR